MKYQIPKDWKQNSDGKQCECGAFYKKECACPADWTPQEIYKLSRLV